MYSEATVECRGNARKGKTTSSRDRNKKFRLFPLKKILNFFFFMGIQSALIDPSSLPFLFFLNTSQADDIDKRYVVNGQTDDQRSTL